MIIRDLAKVVFVKVMEQGVPVNKVLAKYNGRYYMKDYSDVFNEIHSKTLIERLNKNDIRFQNAESKIISIDIYSNMAIKRYSNQLYVFKNDQYLLLKTPSFCEIMFAEYKVNHGNQPAVDIVVSSFDDKVPEEVEDVVKRIKHNIFLIPDALFALAGYLGSAYHKNNSKVYMIKLLKKFYPDPRELKLFFVAISCFNSRTIADKILELQNVISSMDIKNIMALNDLPDYKE